MVFSDASFLFLFLPLALVIGLAAQRVAFVPAVLLTSLLFYFWTGGAMTIILVASILINYVGGLVLARRRESWILVLFVGLNLLILAYYKYAGFLAVNVSGFVGGNAPVFFTSIVLPVGISFFTFQGISYLIDVFRGDVEAEPNPIVFGAYDLVLPAAHRGPDRALSRCRAGLPRAADQQGPVRRRGRPLRPRPAQEGADRRQRVRHRQRRLRPAAGRADLRHRLARRPRLRASRSTSISPAIRTWPSASARMFGFRIPENFNHPYSSRSITEFWRRWHISLSHLVSRLPLHSARRQPARQRSPTYRNLLIVFLLVRPLARRRVDLHRLGRL